MFIGIDLGTTALKVAAFDARSAKLLAGVSKRLRVDLDDAGRREQCPASILRALQKAITEIGKTVGDLRKVQGIGLAAQGGSTIIADRQTGNALTPMTLWNDACAFPEYQALVKAKPARYWRNFSLRDAPGMGLARLQKMRRESPELLHENNLYSGAGEYLYYQLTSQWRQDAGNALQIGCYDARHGKLIAAPANLVGAPLSFFAPMRNRHETHPLSEGAAKRLGLPVGIPVAGPYMDHEAGFMSTAQISEKPLQCSLGTAWVGNFCVPETATLRSPIQLVAPSPTGAGRLVIQPLLTGNVTWDWALQCFVDANLNRALTKQDAIFAASLLPPEGLVALPWLNWPNPLSPDQQGACSFLGVGPSTTQSDFLRAVAAGMCYELARVFEEAKDRTVFDSVVLSGGASKGIHFQQILATLFETIPVYQMIEEDWMGARGTLHVFGMKPPRTLTKRLPSLKKSDAQALINGQAVYRKAFSTLYGNVSAGKALSFPVRQEK